MLFKIVLIYCTFVLFFYSCGKKEYSINTQSNERKNPCENIELKLQDLKLDQVWETNIELCAIKIEENNEFKEITFGELKADHSDWLYHFIFRVSYQKDKFFGKIIWIKKLGTDPIFLE